MFTSESRRRRGVEVRGVDACEYHCRMQTRFAITVAIATICSALACDADAASDVAQSSVYKCRQANGAVLYQDYACKDGVVVDLKPDAADPAAIRRLERAQAESEREAARRRASEERSRAARERLLSEAEASQDYTPQMETVYVPAYPYYVPRGRPHVQPHASRASHEQRRELHARRVPAIVRRPHAG